MRSWNSQMQFKVKKMFCSTKFKPAAVDILNNKFLEKKDSISTDF